MTPHDFITRWQAADLSERAACQSHFADLCVVLGQPKPTDVDPTGSWYAFEKGVDTADGKKGWGDVWLKGKFGWEYNGDVYPVGCPNVLPSDSSSRPESDSWTAASRD